MNVIELFKLFGSILIDDKEAIKALTNSEKEAKNASKSFDKMADAGLKIGEFALKGAAIAGAAILGMATKGTKSADDLAKAINGIEASTGLADDGTNKFRESMINLYNNNFGDSFEDIGVAMGEINRQTGLTGKALEDTTRNALILRDTFEMEINESTRAAEQLMKTFGYTSEQAFNLIAQGAQGGLDKNGDMLDSINEYAVHFEQLGLGGEEMFNALLMGAESGAFSIDKVGDAFKEFGIRVKDGSKASTEAFVSMGLDSEEMTNKFAQGGDAAEEAYYKVYDALSAMKDPVEQNTAGVALFGTMWEDLGSTATLAAMGLADEFNATIGTMESINAVKYDTVGEAISGIGRKFETGVLIPIGEKILPILEKFATKIDENMPAIQATVDSAMSFASDLFDTLATSIGWVKDNLEIIIPVVAGFASAMGALTIIGVIKKLIDAWKASTVIQTFVQHGLNAALKANPIGAVITLIGLLVAAGIYLYRNWDTVKEKAQALWTSIRTVFDGIKSTITEKIEGAKDAVEKAINKIKGFFNFDFKWPKLKMPSFGIKGTMNPIKWLTEGIPKLSVNWNAAGAIFDKPTIFNTPYGLQGLGEKGPEAVAPISKLQDYIREAVGQANGSGETDSLLKAILKALSNMQVVMDTGQLVGIMTEEMNFNTQRNLGGVGVV